MGVQSFYFYLATHFRRRERIPNPNRFICTVKGITLLAQESQHQTIVSNSKIVECTASLLHNLDAVMCSHNMLALHFEEKQRSSSARG